MASIANDTAIIDELTNGSGDMHSLVAKMVFVDTIPRDFPVKDIAKAYHKERQEAKTYEFLINYGGNANTMVSNYGITLEKANNIYNNYMQGFEGLQKYQAFRRKDWLDKGYILLSDKTGHKAYISDYEELMDIQEWMKTLDWAYYAEMKKNNPTCETVSKVRKFFRRKSDIEKSSINYPIQAGGSMCLRTALINFFEYLRTNDLLFKVLICVPPYDEVNVEAPEEIAEEVSKLLYNCMVKAGAYFCTRCKLDADLSTNEDGSLPNHWVH